MHEKTLTKRPGFPLLSRKGSLFASSPLSARSRVQHFQGRGLSKFLLDRGHDAHLGVFVHLQGHPHLALLRLSEGRTLLDNPVLDHRSAGELIVQLHQRLRAVASVHWGTDVDLIDGSKPQNGDVLLTEKFHGQGPYAPMRKWMDENASKFGFILPYTQDPKRKGFYYEPWHYSYAPLSIPMLNAYLKLDLNLLLIPESLEGSSSVTPEFLSRYITEHVLSIAPILK